MNDEMTKVQNYLNELNVVVSKVDTDETLFVVDDKEKGFSNLFIDVENPLVVVQQVLGKMKDVESSKDLKKLMEANSTLVHGAFCLSDDVVMFRDTLDVQNLDRNELESTLNALSLAMVEHSKTLLEVLK